MKQHIRTIRPYVELYRDDRTGIAMVEDGTSGTGASCHPNIDDSGSVRGMRKLGCWSKTARTVRAMGFIHNIDRLVITDELDKVAADACQCVACSIRRNPTVSGA